MGLLFGTLWGLQELRFAAIFEAVRSALSCFTMAVVCCVLSFRRNRRSRDSTVVPFI
ncbi:unnamed protein product [Linum tenue]|uniref:Uncharacterized protein n=1 Tax=Linum tenue TaxID=586396 RepID=A0AAV0PD02_9ROSI|nr:unnamed protein product [Linum tenue]